MEVQKQVGISNGSNELIKGNNIKEMSKGIDNSVTNIGDISKNKKVVNKIYKIIISGHS